jgi:hypothetical protein
MPDQPSVIMSQTVISEPTRMMTRPIDRDHRLSMITETGQRRPMAAGQQA